MIRAKPGLREFFEVENHLSRLGDRNRYAALDDDESRTDKTAVYFNWLQLPLTASVGVDWLL